MRKSFASNLHQAMAADVRIVLITADLGFGLFDQIRDDFPERFFNVGAAEVCAVSVAVGFALSGRKPVVYSITPFLLWRAAEVIRNYVDHEKIPVKLVGSGRDDDYEHDGFSHNATDDRTLMHLFSNVVCRWPSDAAVVPMCVKEMLQTEKPYYLNLKR